MRPALFTALLLTAGCTGHVSDKGGSEAEEGAAPAVLPRLPPSST